MRIAVIGGGIAGCAAAHRLIGSNASVVLFEAGEHLGGKVGTTTLGGEVTPTAADAFLARRPEVTALATELGLADELISPVATQAKIFREGVLHPLPPSVLGIPVEPAALAESGLISAAGAARATADLTMPDDRPDQDESVGQLVRRRLGDEVLEYLVDPLLGGINAGDSDQLSIQAGAAQIAEMSRSSPSIVAAAREMKARTIANSSPVFHGLRSGLGTLFSALHDALEEAANITVRLKSAVEALDRSGSDWLVNGEVFDRVILATPAGPTARLLAPLDAAASATFAELDYSSVMLALLLMPSGSVPLDPEISGVLVPRKEGHHVTAISVATHKWPSMRTDDRNVLRVSVGRRTDTRWQSMSDEELLETVRGDLADIIGLTTEPDEAHLTRWQDALPQFDVGHMDRMRAATTQLAISAPGLHLAGAMLEGVGLPACVQTGWKAADACIAQSR